MRVSSGFRFFVFGERRDSENKKYGKPWLRLTQDRFGSERLASINKLELSLLMGLSQIASRGELSLNEPRVAHKPIRPYNAML
jgi:hypothetical protein